MVEDSKKEVPYEMCHRCNGRGYHGYVLSEGRMECMGCNGTGNELWMCDPEVQKILNSENKESEKKCTLNQITIDRR